MKKSKTLETARVQTSAQMQSAQKLAKLGGSMPEIVRVPRRRWVGGLLVQVDTAK